MNNLINYSIPAIVTVVAAAIAIVTLNIFLSTRKSPVFAFILPTLSFLLSAVFLIFGLVLSSDDNAQVTSIEIIRFFLMFNIPTAILAVTSFLTRYFYKKM